MLGGCGRKHVARGYCDCHYSRIKKTGTAVLPPKSSLVDRFWAKVLKSSDGCWVWGGAPTSSGYGSICEGAKKVWSAHALSLVIHGRPRPSGLHIDHLCRNRMCVNPDHLEYVTLAENLRRGVGPQAINSAKTHCIRGHEFLLENTYVDSKTKKRKCRTCAKEVARARYWRLLSLPAQATLKRIEELGK